MGKTEPLLVFRGRIVNGVRQYFRPGKHAELLKSLEGKEFEETLCEKDEPVTHDQHGYLRGGIIRNTCMKTELFEGWYEDEIYEYFADKYLSIPIIKTIDGKSVEFKRRLSMASCGKKKASEFINRVLHELAENGIYPDPPEDYILHKYSSNTHDKPDSTTNS